MKTFIAYITALSMCFFTMGCYSLQAVQLSDQRTIHDQECEVLKTDGEAIEHPQWAIDSLRIGSTAVTVFSKNGAVASYPLDSIHKLYVDQINWPRTIIASTLGMIILIPIIIVVSNPPRFGG